MPADKVSFQLTAYQLVRMSVSKYEYFPAGNMPASQKCNYNIYIITDHVVLPGEVK